MIILNGYKTQTVITTLNTLFYLDEFAINMLRTTIERYMYDFISMFHFHVVYILVKLRGIKNCALN